MGDYVIKWGQETAWAAFMAALEAFYLYAHGLTLDDVLANPWAALAGAGLIVGRVVGALVLNAIGKLGSS